MPNTNVFTGADGSLTLSSTSGPEGTAAQTVIEANALTSVGRVQGVTIEVTSEIRPFHEVGQRYATELRAGNITVRGTIKRAYINGALLSLMLGEASAQRPAASFVQPSFNMTVMVQNPAQPGVTSTVNLFGVKLDTWNYGMPEDDFVLESANFQALYLTVEDAAA
jgi:hypothetical protein